MKNKRIILNPFQINCYIYHDEESKEGIIIDPAAYDISEENLIKDYIEQNQIKIKFIINTHGHIDHILGNDFAKKYLKVPILIHKEDEILVKNYSIQASMFGLNMAKPPEFDDYFDESTKIILGTNLLEIIHTPGHSRGGICILDKKNKTIFTGDVLFRESIGRTDLHGGDYEVLIDSIKNKIFKECDDDFVIYPGHNESSTIGYEKKYNPFLN